MLTLVAPLVVLVVLLSICIQANAQSETDSNRPPCTTARCEKIQAYVKAHYCGHSPAGNGPDNGCELLPPKTQPAGVEVLANYHCSYNDETNQQHCVQSGQVPPAILSILINELRKAGLRANARGHIGFTIWKYRAEGWLVADASYSKLAGDKVGLCQVIVRIDVESHVLVLRKCPFIVMEADADTPDITEWALVDVADADGSGRPDIVLEGDAYEDHWFEVLSVHDGRCETIFSGLGYYL